MAYIGQVIEIKNLKLKLKIGSEVFCMPERKFGLIIVLQKVGVKRGMASNPDPEVRPIGIPNFM